MKSIQRLPPEVQAAVDTALSEDMLALRLARAQQVRTSYRFRSFGDIVIVTSPEGKKYRVNKSLGTCTCPDFLYRCAPAGIPCKHVIAVRKRERRVSVGGKGGHDTGSREQEAA